MITMTDNTVLTMALPSDLDASGRTFGREEISFLEQAVSSGTLTSTKGTLVKELEKRFAEKLGVKHAFACTSGTAAIHLAIAAIDPEPGDEIITTAITDMGALTPILYQGAIPVFADVDPRSYNITAASVEACLSERTRAIIATHLFGNPCEMNEILELAASHNLPVIEDSAQAFLAEYDGMMIGTIGNIGCFSLQQGKHITCGEGGLVVTDDDALARRMFLYINKAWGYGDAKPDHYFLALNYRMNELTGAVALAQLPKLDASVASRIEMAGRLTELLQGLAGIETPWIGPKSVHTYWKYCLRVDKDIVPDGAVGLATSLKKRGIASAPRYIQKPAFMCEVFAEQRTFGNSRFPFTLARPAAIDYDRKNFTGTFEALESVLVLPWNECYTSEHVEYIARAIRESTESLGE